MEKQIFFGGVYNVYGSRPDFARVFSCLVGRDAPQD